jgi:uncharacterized membrane protein HdeD (DUF308 family)
LWLIAGALWILVAASILRFDDASVGTVGVIAGVMLLGAGFEYLLLPTIERGLRWLSYLFGGLLIVGGVVALANPGATFLALATTLGYTFVVIGVMWVVEAFLGRDYTNLWWFNLIAGVVMMVQGFWLSGQFVFTQAAALLIFAGIWAMMRGFLDITTFFTLRTAAAAIPTE